MKRIIIALLFVCPVIAWGQATTTITGTVYKTNGVTPYDSCWIKLIGVFARGVLTGTGIQVLYTDTAGHISFSVPRTDSTIIVLQAPITGLNKIGGQALQVPNADTAQLSSLVSITLPTAMAVLLPPLDTIRNIVSDSADAVRGEFSHDLHFPDPCTINIYAGDTLSSLLHAENWSRLNCISMIVTVNYYGGVLDTNEWFAIGSGATVLRVHNSLVGDHGEFNTVILDPYINYDMSVNAGEQIYGPTYYSGVAGNLNYLDAQQSGTILNNVYGCRVTYMDSYNTAHGDNPAVNWLHSTIYGDTLLTSLHGNTFTGSKYFSTDIRGVHAENSEYQSSEWTDCRISTSHYDCSNWLMIRWRGMTLENSEFCGMAGTGQPYGGPSNFDSSITSYVTATTCNFGSSLWIGAKRHHNSGFWTSIGCYYASSNFTNCDLTRNIFIACDMTNCVWTGAICDYINLTGCSGMPDKATWKATVASYSGGIWVDGTAL